MNALFDLCRVHTPTSGTGPIALGSSVAGYLDFAGAGVPDGATVSYGIKDIAASETGAGVYNAAAGTLTRSVYKSTGAGHNTPIALSGAAEVFITALAEDFWTGGPFLPLSGGTLSGSLQFSGGAGIQYDYQPPTSGVGLNHIAFGWDGGTILASVDATGIPGKLATQAWVSGAYLPLSGGVLTGPIAVTGSSAAYAFDDRTNAARWFWYADGATNAYLNLTAAGHRLAIDSGGNLTIAGSATVQGEYLYLNGGSGTVNANGGPLVYGDTGNMVIKPGPSNGILFFQDYPGTTRASINLATGDAIFNAITANGTLYANNGLIAGPNGVVSGGGLQMANANWLYGVDTGGVAHGLLTLWSDNQVYLSQTDRALFLRGSVIYIGDASGNVAQFSHADAPAPSITNFTPARWRLAVHSGDDPNAGAIDYRGYNSSCLNIVGAGTTSGNRVVMIWDALYVEGSITTQNGGNLNLSGGYIFFYGASGAGPLITADNSNMQFNLGPSNGYFVFASNDSAWKAWVHSDGSAWFAGDVQVVNTVLSTGFGFSGQFRMAPGNSTSGYGSFFRNDGSNTYLLLTANNDALGSWNSLRPFTVINATGAVTLGHDATVGGNLIVNSSVSIANQCAVHGGGGIYLFDDRTSGTTWGIYATANTARLYNASFGDLFMFDTQGYLYPGQGNNQGLVGVSGNAFAGMNAYAFNNVSDRRDKRDIEDLPDCLPIVAYLKPQRFKWAHGPDTERTHWGFVAQDVGTAMADCDFGGHQIDPESGTQSLSYHELTAVLWKAVQELAAKVDAMGAAA